MDSERTSATPSGEQWHQESKYANACDSAPFVSVVIPCRNEARFIGACLDSILGNDYPKDRLEVLVVDGMSQDGTSEIVKEYAKRYSCIRLLDNPKRITPAALNIGIARSSGEIIMRMDVHARVGTTYISRCVQALEDYRADNVGGIMRTHPRQETPIAKAIASSLSHPFGVGNSYFRISSKEPRWVDTIFGGCYRREVFDKVGLFNEGLARGQDLEFNLRLRKAGGRTLLVPDIVSYYYARSDMKSFWQHNWKNGVWAILPFLYSTIMPVRWRHLVPLAFVLGLLGSVVVATVHPAGLWVLGGIAGTYAIGNVAASVQVTLREKDVRYLVAMPVVFASLHVAYGLGSLWGLVKVFVCTVFKSKHAYHQGEVKRPC